jgi:hypothetical protein
VVTVAQWADLIDALYDALEALDTTDYRYEASERWSRGLYLDPNAGMPAHLQATIWTGGIEEWGASTVRHAAVLGFVHRLTPDDDAVSQARLCAATRAALDCLQGFDLRPVRVQPSTTTVDILSPEWALVSVNFTILYTRTRPVR